MPGDVRVLIVDDSNDDTLLLVEALRQGGLTARYRRVDTPEAMRQALAEESWDAVLADFRMPHFSGPSALQVLLDSGKDIPYIVVSGTVTEQQAIDMMRQGASDFILKQSLGRLVPALKRELEDARIRQERRQALSALQENELRYRTLFALVPDALLLFDAQTLRIVDANEAALRLYGYSIDELRSLTVVDLSDQPKETLAAVQAKMLDNTLLSQRRHRKKNGERFPVEIAGRKFILDQHSFIFASLRDITERVHAAEALEREQAFLSSAIELLPFPIIFNNATGDILRANRASYEFFGGQDIGSWWNRDFYLPDSHQPIPRAEWPMMRAARGEVVTPTEGTLVLQQGREVDVLAVAAPVYVRGTLEATVVAFMDITPIKELDHAKNRFLALLSHELRTPLTNILGWAALAAESPEVVPDALHIIERNADAQRRMLEQLMEVTRLLYGKFTLQREQGELWAVMESAVQSLRDEITERQLIIAMEPPQATLPVCADLKRLREALESVLDRALHVTPTGGRVTVRAVREGEMGVLTIADSGPVTSPALLPHMFELFQVTPEEERVGGGLGLALPLAKAILERHAGQVTMHSAGEGQGNEVTLSLPLC